MIVERSLPPSREANPFATCWTRPGALPYLTTRQLDPQALLERLSRCNWRGRIVGPHGVGKTALLGELALRVRQQGGDAERIDARFDGENSANLLLVDGMERVTALRRYALLRRWRSRGQGYVITAHRDSVWDLSAPALLCRLRASPELMLRLFDYLTRGGSTPVTASDAEQAFDRRRADLRAVWFDLYNLHETRQRVRTAAVQVSYEQMTA